MTHSELLPQNRILVVDDMVANLKLLDDLLSKQGYSMQLATNGQLAINSLSIALPDLILLDINMPGMTGYQVCREIKKRSDCQDIPIIFISALDYMADKLKGFELGAVDYITKPFNQAEVLARVAVHLKLRAMKLELQKQNKRLEEEIINRKLTEKQLIEAEKMASLGRLVSGVAHEINTPLGNAITAISSLDPIISSIEQALVSGQIKRSEHLELINQMKEIKAMAFRNLERTAKLINKFKLVAVEFSGTKQSSFNISELLNFLLMGFQPQLELSGHQIHLDCPENIQVHAQQDALLQIGTQLINNTLSHGFENKTQGSILISASELNDQVTIEYQDNGKGMNEEQLSNIFEPFYTTQRSQGHTGLGMHIVYNQVKQALKGNIVCTSKLDLGTEFIIKFPVEREP